MNGIKTTLIGLSSTLILVLGACSEGNTNNTGSNPAQNSSHSSHNHSKGDGHSNNSSKGQVIEVGKYHLKLVPVAESKGFSSGFFSCKQELTRKLLIMLE